MSNSNESNTRSTGTASASAPPRPLRRPDESEADFLARQATEAKDAIKQTLAQAKAQLKDGVDPRMWTKEFPFLSLGVAAAAGFTAAVMLIPSKEEQALRRLEKIERALMPERLRGGHEGNGHAVHDDEDGGAKAYSKGHASFLSGLGRQVLETVKPALLSALTAGITAKTAKTSPEEVAAAAGGGGGVDAPAPGYPYPAGMNPPMGGARPSQEERTGGPPDPSAAI